MTPTTRLSSSAKGHVVPGTKNIEAAFSDQAHLVNVPCHKDCKQRPAKRGDYHGYAENQILQRNSPLYQGPHCVAGVVLYFGLALVRCCGQAIWPRCETL